MIDSNKLIRDFNGSDNALVMQARYLYTAFVMYKAEIEQYTLFFTPQWVSDYLLRIDEAKELLEDGYYKARVQVMTKQIDEKKESAVEMMAELFDYVKLAHKNRADIEAYRARELYRAASDPYEVIDLGERAVNLASQPEELPLLEGVGYSMVKLDMLRMELELMGTMLEERERRQSARLKATAERIEKLNGLFGMMRELSQGAKLAGRRNPSLRKAFRLYGKRTRGKAKKGGEVEIEDAAQVAEPGDV